MVVRTSIALFTLAILFGAQSSYADDAACTISQDSFNHINDRHCSGMAGKSQLLPEYCGTKENMATFCKMVQTAPGVQRTEQPDKRIRYDADLGKAVGTKGEKWGRVIIKGTANGEVVTEFPEFSAAGSGE